MNPAAADDDAPDTADILVAGARARAQTRVVVEGNMPAYLGMPASVAIADVAAAALLLPAVRTPFLLLLSSPNPSS